MQDVEAYLTGAVERSDCVQPPDLLPPLEEPALESAAPEPAAKRARLGDADGAGEKVSACMCCRRVQQSSNRNELRRRA